MTTKTAEVAPKPVLSIGTLSKTFSGTTVLSGVRLEVGPGEVHGLVGENGSGKSTLVKLLSGFHVPDAGAAVELGGRPVKLPLTAAQLRERGLRFVHQDLGLAPTLTVADNLLVDDLAIRSRWWLRASVERQKAREVMAPFGRALDPSTKVRELSAADRAHVAIVRAVSQLNQRRSEGDAEPGLLVLDEITAFLPREGRDQLFSLIHDVAARGDSVLFVSHYIDEVLDITSRVSVLRDGRLVETISTDSVDSDGLVKLIIGRSLGVELSGSQESTPVGREVARVSGLAGQLVHGVDFVVHHGEVVGLFGLLGSGFEEVPGLLFGSTQEAHGELRLGDKTVDLATLSPRQATELGIAFVPENRQTEGAAESLTVAENLMHHRILRRYQKRSKLNRRAVAREVRALLDEYDVRPRSPNAQLSQLSGGNQQRVIMAKWLSTEPSLLLLHEPTHGVDVGSREQILLRIRSAARNGMAVVCASSDPEQLAELCDRVLTFERGKVVAELTGLDLNKDTIVESSYRSAISASSLDARNGGTE
jgi:ribose transport system ATP-binding protein